MFATIINDCYCPNARGRQETRVASLLNCPTNFIQVNSDLEASGNLIDALDAGLGRKGVVLVNVAPRNGEAKKWENGSPFAYFYYQKTLVISTISGLTLSLVKKTKLIKKVEVVYLKETVEKNLPEKKDCLSQTQFRSFEFTPRLASWIFEGGDIKSESRDLRETPDLESLVWCVDNFGNIKTTVLAETEEEKCLKTKLDRSGFDSSPKLKDVPEEKPAIITGSSGIEEKRFLEIVINGKSASDQLKIKVGDDLNKLEL